MSEPILMNSPEEWDFTEYIDSLIQKDEAVDLEFKSAKSGLPNTDGGGLCREGYLTSTGNGRGTKYHICNTQKVESSEQKVESSEQKVESSEQKVESSEQKVESSEQVVNIGAKKNLRFNELQAQIVSIAVDYISLEEIATNVNKSIQYLINKIIPKMIETGSIERLYPGTPNHPKQKYRATPPSSFNS